MGESCDMCLMHPQVVKELDIVVKDLKEFKDEVRHDQQRYHRIGDESEKMMDDHKVNIRNVHEKLTNLGQTSIKNEMSLKAIHKRMDMNDEQRLHLEGLFENHLKDEEANMKDNRKILVGVVLAVLSYVIGFGVYIVGSISDNELQTKLLQKDIKYIKAVVVKHMERPNGK